MTFRESGLERIQIGEEILTGKRVGRNLFLISVRNDDLDPPYETIVTSQCVKCKMVILPVTGCKCGPTWHYGERHIGIC